MYLKSIKLKNYGPISDLQIDLSFRDDNSPTPLVLLGINGSGKSILLSVIVDAIIRMRMNVFGESPEVAKTKHFKPMSPRVITNQTKPYASAECNFAAGEKKVQFLELISKPDGNERGNLPDDFVPPTNFEAYHFNKLGSYKDIEITGGDIIDEISNTVFAYYPAGRAEKPNWLNKDSKIKFQLAKNYIGVAKYKLWRTDLIPEISTWVLDVVLDTELYDTETIQVPVNGVNTDLKRPIEGSNRKILMHLNQLLTDIILLGSDRYTSVRLAVSQRYRGSRQVVVMGKKTNGTEEYIVQTLSDLSTGELMVFSMFSDIIRLAELKGWDKQNLEDISGIVIIDEADLHLHIKLQRDLLPKLMSKFPKVQFLLTTHSPFLSIGLSESAVELRNMPDGVSIAPSEFAEFQVAYETFREQQNSFQEAYSQLEEAITLSETPLIVTEGKTDWQHLKRALEKFKEQGEFEGLDLLFHETGGNMGDGELAKLFEANKRLSPNRSVVFIFDRDNAQIVRKFEPADDNFLIAGSVAAMCLAVPEHRNDNPGICIEHLYSDESLATFIPGTQKRLRFEHEIGFSSDRHTAYLRPTPGIQSLKIYDQDVANLGNEDGTDVGDLAISKSVFFSEIVDSELGDNFDLEGFRPTLQRIQNALTALNQPAN